MATFSEKFEKRMIEQRLTQQLVAEALGTRQPVISDWLRFNRAPKDWRRMLNLARLLGVTVEYLIDPDQEEPRPSGLSREEAELLAQIREMGIVEASQRLGAAHKAGAGGRGRETEVVPRGFRDGSGRPVTGPKSTPKSG